MSKKVIMLSVAVLFGMQAGLAMAANPDTGPGCGLGKLAWGDYAHQKNIAPQVMMHPPFELGSDEGGEFVPGHKRRGLQHSHPD